jgi:hypothetical protein
MFTDIDMPRWARAGEPFVVRIAVRNTGALAWMQEYAQWPASAWPMLRLGCLIFDEDGKPAQPHEGTRILLPTTVAVGEAVTFLGQMTAPSTPGEYVIAWDMVSELHCWFSQCGSAVARCPLSVREFVPALQPQSSSGAGSSRITTRASRTGDVP